MNSSDEIKFRAIEPSDAEMLYLWENDSELWPEGRVCRPMSLFALKSYAESVSDNPFADGQLRLVVCRASDGLAIGLADLFEISAKDGNAEAGIFVAPEFRGQGYATPIINKLCDYAGEKCLHLHTICAKIAESNIPSRKAFEHAGFKCEGCLRSWLHIGRSRQNILIFQKFL